MYTITQVTLSMQDLTKVLYNHSGSNIPGVFDRNIKLTVTAPQWLIAKNINTNFSAKE